MSLRSRSANLVAWLVLAAVLAALAALSWTGRTQPIIAAPTPADPDPGGQPRFWFKGNTHTHARITLGEYSHGDSSREDVARWYHDHGYHFVSITDHNRYTDAAEIDLRMNARKDFLLVSGMEVTSDYRYPGVEREGERKIHSTAFNTSRKTDWKFDSPDKAAILSLQARRIAADGGVPIINHPNYRFQLELPDLLGAEGARLMEIANAHPRSNHGGHAGFRPGVEALWDQALSRGKLLYGVAVDDAHEFAWYRRALRQFGYAPPGGAWIMVQAEELSPAAISAALVNGEFYASTGVYLGRVRREGGHYEVAVDMDRTRHETRHRWIRDAAPIVISDDTHFVIEFIGSHGRVLHSVHDREQASIGLDPAHGYVRARVSYLEKVRDWLDRDRARAFYAWTQPVMTSASAE